MKLILGSIIAALLVSLGFQVIPRGQGWDGVFTMAFFLYWVIAMAYITGQSSEKDKHEKELSKERLRTSTDTESRDELFNNAVEIWKNNKKVSPSMLQRKLQIGYARAARLFDMLIEEGFVSEDDKT